MELRFSVVTVVFNGETVLWKTVESVLNQTVAPFEYLIVDGGSSDGTVRIARSYETAFAEKGVCFRIYSEKDTGIYNAMNKAIRLAQGNFVSFLNAGDWYETDALENIREFYREAPFEMTYGGVNYIYPNGTASPKMSKLDRFPITSRHWNHPSMFLDRDIYCKYFFDESYKTYADFELYLKLRKDGTKILVIDKVIANFVAGGVSSVPDFRKAMTRAKEKYRAYRRNGYGPVYFLEAYGWELMKMLYIRLRS